MKNQSSNVSIACRLIAASLLILGSMSISCSRRPANENDNDNSNVNTNLNQNVNENSSNSNLNENGNPPAHQILLQFAGSQLTDSVVARALAGNNVEFSFTGDSNVQSVPTQFNEIEIIVPSSLAGTFQDVGLRIALDSEGFPGSILSADGTYLALTYNDDLAQLTYTYVSDFSIDNSKRTYRESIEVELSDDVEPAASEEEVVCELLDAYRETMDAVLAQCDVDPSLPICSGNISLAHSELMSFCEEETDISLVSNTLPDDTGRVGGLSIPLGIYIESDDSVITPNTGLGLTGVAFGGTPPYSFRWNVTEGPEQPDVFPSSTDGPIRTASVTFSFEGEYTIQLEINDIDGNQAFYQQSLLVQEDPEALVVTVSTSQLGENPYLIALDTTVSGGVPPYQYQWEPVDGVSFEQTNAADTTATFSDEGNYNLRVTITDSLNTIASTTVPVTITDPQTSMRATITYPACPQTTSHDTCVDLEGQISLGVTLANVAADANLQYEWTVLQGTPLVIGDTTESINIVPTALETIRVEVEVENLLNNRTARDEVVIDVYETGTLSVIITAEDSGILNQPQTMVSAVTGPVIDVLSYNWTTVPAGLGTFDDATDGVVEFTPTEKGTVTVKVEVTDTGSSNPAATDTFDLQVTPFSAAIAGSTLVTSNEPIEPYTVVLGDDAPNTLSYEWAVEEEDPSDSMVVTGLVTDEPTFEVQVAGDGYFTITMTVTDTTDPDNEATRSLLVESVCSVLDEPSPSANFMSEVIHSLPVTADVVPQDITSFSLACGDDPEADVEYTWQRVDDDDIDILLSNADQFEASLEIEDVGSEYGPLLIACLASNTATLCDKTSDPIAIYFEPEVTASYAPADPEAGDAVTITCEQESGTTVSEFEWQQLDLNGTGVPLDEYTVTLFEQPTQGTASFTMPSLATGKRLYFRCRGIFEDDLVGEYSDDESDWVIIPPTAP